MHSWTDLDVLADLQLQRERRRLRDADEAAARLNGHGAAGGIAPLAAAGSIGAQSAGGGRGEADGGSDAPLPNLAWADDSEL
jgi:hypothetical protein